MSEGEMKNILFKINNDFYDNLSKEMIVLREKCINDLKTIQTHGFHLNKTQTFTYIYHLVAELSFFNDDEVLEVLSGLGITKLTTKIFQPYGEFFESLNILHKESKFLYPSETIWGFYKIYSQSFFKIQLSTDLGLNLSKIIKKVNGITAIYSTLFTKKKTKRLLDHYGVVVSSDTWIDFPWE